MPSVVVLNKRDMPEVQAQERELLSQLQKAAGHKRLLPISAAARDNCDVLVRRLRKLLASAKLTGPPPRPTEQLMVMLAARSYHQHSKLSTRNPLMALDGQLMTSIRLGALDAPALLVSRRSPPRLTRTLSRLPDP